MPSKPPLLYVSQKKTLTALGERLRLARLRRNLGTEIVSQRAGISRMTLFRAESGSPAVALGTLVRLLAVLGLETDIDLIARDDKFGRALQDQALAPRRRRARAKTPGELPESAT
jgi:transcriptional regulator with XRE-family HTH domain